MSAVSVRIESDQIDDFEAPLPAKVKKRRLRKSKESAPRNEGNSANDDTGVIFEEKRNKSRTPRRRPQNYQKVTSLDSTPNDSTFPLHNNGSMLTIPSPTRKEGLTPDELESCCGVLSDDSASPCRRPITCTLHSENSKLTVPGRKRSYFILLQEWVSSHPNGNPGQVPPVPLFRAKFPLRNSHFMRGVITGLYNEALKINKEGNAASEPANPADSSANHRPPGVPRKTMLLNPRGSTLSKPDSSTPPEPKKTKPRAKRTSQPIPSPFHFPTASSFAPQSPQAPPDASLPAPDPLTVPKPSKPRARAPRAKIPKPTLPRSARSNSESTPTDSGDQNVDNGKGKSSQGKRQKKAPVRNEEEKRPAAVPVDSGSQQEVPKAAAVGGGLASFLGDEFLGLDFGSELDASLTAAPQFNLGEIMGQDEREDGFDDGFGMFSRGFGGEVDVQGQEEKESPPYNDDDDWGPLP